MSGHRLTAGALEIELDLMKTVSGDGIEHRFERIDAR